MERDIVTKVIEDSRITIPNQERSGCVGPATGAGCALRVAGVTALVASGVSLAVGERDFASNIYEYMILFGGVVYGVRLLVRNPVTKSINATSRRQRGLGSD